MPDIKFEGFAIGTPVSLSAQQAAQSASGAVAHWAGLPVTDDLSVTIAPSRTTGIAPMGATYEADAISDAARVAIPFNDIEGVWGTGDGGNWTALTNSPTWGTSKAAAYGPLMAHVFDTPGTYAVTHTAYDGTNAATAPAAEITVLDPDDVFVGQDTAVVSQLSDFTGMPAGAAQFTTIAAAEAHLAGRQNQRLLLRAGETFTDQRVYLNETSGSGKKGFIGSFGTANDGRAIFDRTDISQFPREAANFSGSGWDEMIVSDLDCIGPNDNTVLSLTINPNNGQPYSDGGVMVSFNNSGAALTAHKTVWNCILRNNPTEAVKANGTNGDNPARNMIVGNTFIEGWGAYAVFGGDYGDFGICGCTIRNPSNTLNGTDDVFGILSKSSAFRFSRPRGYTVLSNNDIATFTNNFSSDTNRVMHNQIRWNSGGSEIDPVNNPGVTTTSNQKLAIDRLRAEGGEFKLYNATGGGFGPVDSFIVVDRVHYINSDAATQPLDIPLGGTTVRNAIIVAPDMFPGTGSGTRQMIDFAQNVKDRKSEVYSCALVDLRTDANARNRSGENLNRDFVVENTFENTAAGSFLGNNITYAPNMVDGGANGTDPLDVMPTYDVGFTLERYVINGTGVIEEDPLRSYGNAPTALFKPQSGSMFIGAATGKTSVLDWDGNLRSSFSGPDSVGPFEFDTGSAGTSGNGGGGGGGGGTVSLMAAGALDWQNTPVQQDDTLQFEFSGPITAGTGTLRLRAKGNSGYATVETIDIANTTISGNTLTLSPGTARLPLMDYSLQIDADALVEFDGVSDDTAAAFRIDRGYVQPSLDTNDYTTVYDGQTFSGPGIGLDIDGVSNVLVRNCTISSSNDTGARVGNATDVVFYQCTFDDIANFGAQLRDSSGNGSARVYFIDCDFTNVFSDGIQIPQAADIGEDNPDCVVIGCTFDDVALPQSGAGKHMVYTQGTNNMVLDCVVRGLSDANGISVRSDGIVHGNDVEINSDRYPGAGAGIKYFSDHRTGPSKRLIIADNLISSPAGELDAGIDLDRTTSNQFGSDGDWVVNDFYLLRNTFGGGMDDNVVIDGELTNLSFVTITEYA